MLKLMLGRAGSGKSTAVLRRLSQSAAQRPQVLIVPEQQSHEMERALCKEGGDSISLNAEVLSFSRLANRVFQEAGGLGEAELDSGGRLLLMYRAVQSVMSQLTVYGKPSKRPAFLQALLDTMDELKSCCVPPEALMTAGTELEGLEGSKLHDLGLICSTYDALTAGAALDPRDRLTRVADRLDHCHWAEGRDLWLDGFTDFTPQQGEVLRRLMGQCANMTVTLTCDHIQEDEGGTGIFSPARRTANSLLRLAQSAGISSEVEHLVTSWEYKTPGLEYLEKTLFQTERVRPQSCHGDVELFRANTVRSEVEWTAARILRLVREDHLRFRDIGVVARCYGDYRDLVESVFQRYGVPVFSSAMTDILEKPVLTLVTAALDIVSGGYTYDDVFRYLKTGLTDLTEEQRDLLENYVLKWNIRGSMWTQDHPWRWHPRGFGQKWKQEDQDLLAQLDDIRRKVSQPLEELRRNSDRTARGQAMALYQFLDRIGLPERLSQRVTGLQDMGKPALADEYRQLWEILCGGLEQCAALLGDSPMDLDEFAQLFRLVLSQYDVGSIPVSLDRVTAGETTRQTGHRVKVLFLLGADDSSIPQVGEQPGLLSDDDRSLLAGYGLELNQTQRDLLYREMTTVYQLCARPSRKLIVSWPGQGPGGEERRASFLVERLKLIFSDLELVQEEDLKGRFRLEAPLPALEQAGRDENARRALSGLPQYRSQLERLDRAADWRRGHLSTQAVNELYGKNVRMSASRMDKYKSCHFAYFMRYGLEAEPRKPAGFTAPEYGTFVHYVLEHVLQDEMFKFHPEHQEPQPLDEEGKKRLHQLTQKAVEKYVKEELNGLEDQSERFKYLFRRLLRAVQAVVDNMAEELLQSRFRPISFELGFGTGDELPPVKLTSNGVTISITGFVDRVDGWVKDDRLYLRVVDYKTGRKSFDLTEIWNGLGLQMLLYLFTLEEDGQKLYGMPVEGAGVLYLPARNAVVKGSRTMSDEEWRKEMDKELTRSGMILDDQDVLDAMEVPEDGSYRFLPLRVSKRTGAISGEALASAEQLGKLGDHVHQILTAICQELASGNVNADPFWRGPEQNACQYCDYAAACHFEEGRGGDCRRWMKKLKANDFWVNIDTEEKSES